MIAYRDSRAGDGAELAQMARRCFTETFGTLYRQQDLSTFLDQAFGEALPGHLVDPDYRIRLAIEDRAIVGFAKLGPVAFPGEWSDAAIELHQLYVLGGHHGDGVGPALMDWAIDAARAASRSEMILSVYTDNHRARRFYARYGFVAIGRYTFMVGEQPDEDILMRLPL